MLRAILVIVFLFSLHSTTYAGRWQSLISATAALKATEAKIQAPEAAVKHPEANLREAVEAVEEKEEDVITKPSYRKRRLFSRR